MAEFPAMPFWFDAYMLDCGHLTDAEHGRYLLILKELWTAPRQRMPNDDEWLARKFRRSVEAVRLEIRPLLEEFCQSDGNWITQRRITREFLFVTKLKHAKSDSAKSRWKKERQVDFAYAPTPTPTPTDSESQYDTDSEPKILKPDPDSQNPPGELFLGQNQVKNPNLKLIESNPSKPTSRQFETCFEEHFWPIYPRKEAKLAAKRKFVAEAKKHTAKAIVEGLRKAVAAWHNAGTEKQFIPHPTTWLHQGRWLDDPPPSAAPTRPRSAPFEHPPQQDPARLHINSRTSPSMEEQIKIQAEYHRKLNQRLKAGRA